MRAARQFALFVALLLGLALLGPAPALAQVAPTPAPAAAAPAGNFETECGKHVGVTNRIAGCVRDSVSNVATAFFGKDTNYDGKPDGGFYPLVSKFIAGFLTLGMAIYGVMAATGMLEKVGRDTLVYLLKVSFIAYFVLHADVMYRYATDAMDALSAVMVQVTPKYGIAEGSTDFSNIKCFTVMEKAADEVGKPVVGPWVAMDCMLDTVFGINMKTSNLAGGNLAGQGEQWFNDNLQGKGLQRGLIYFFFSGMTSSVLGVMLAVLGFIFMWGLAMMIVKALFAYLAGYIGIAFMMIIAPLFIPLALFRTTKEYFDKWAKLVISFTLQPPLILLFVSFSIAATDLALFSGDYSVMYRIAGEASRKPGFNLNKYLEENQAVRQTPAVFGYAKTNADEVIETVESTGNSVLSNRTSACTRALIQNGDGSHPECSDVMPIQAFRNAIDWAKLAEVRDPPVLLSPGTERKEQQISREVMAALIFLGVVVFLMNRLMGVIPYILVDLVGEAKQTPNLLNDTTNQWSRGADQMSSSAGASMKGALTGLVTQRRGGAE